MVTLNTLLEITVYSGILFSAIMLLKRCFRNRMSPFLHFAVWGLLIARLLIPVTLESSVHLIVIPTESQNQMVSEQNQTDVNSDIELLTDTLSTNTTQSSGSQHTQTATTSNIVSDTALSVHQTFSFSTEKIILAIWLAGVGIGLIYLAALYCVLRMRIRRSSQSPSKRLLELFDEVKAELNIKREVKIISQCEYGTPAVLFPKMVLMPVGTLVSMNDEQVKYMLRHELMHFKRGDHILGLLLSVLNAVYWFSPIVWIAFKLIRADMETACDSDVVRYFSSDEKSTYAAIILSLFSKKQYGNLVLGMVQGNTRHIAEKRIRGVFMNNKSNRNVKITAIVLTSLLLFTCFTTACQPTPEQQAIVGKGDDELDSIIAQTPAPVSEYVAPESWSESFSANNITFDVEAEVKLPDTDLFPVVNVEAMKFTQQDVSTAMDAFFNGATPMNYTIYTKQYIKDLLVESQSRLAQIEAGNLPPDYNEGEEEHLKSYIEQLQKQYATAPDQEVSDTADASLKVDDSGNETVSLVADLDKTEYAVLTVSNFSSTMISRLEFQNYSTNATSDIKIQPFNGTAPNGVNITLEEAQLIAEDTMQQMGITDMIINNVGIANFFANKTTDSSATSQKQAYAFEYSRSFQGIPLTTFSSAMPIDQSDNSGEDSYAPVLKPEKLSIWVDDSGIVSFVWENPTRQLDTVSENVQVKTFDEIKGIFRNQISYHHVNMDDEQEVKIEITSIEFGYFLQPLNNSQNQYRAIPVWDFIGDELIDGISTYQGDSYQYTFLTINAIDGSVINRDVGY